jgi:membrane-associated HD superfamily phosphohydrolase
MNKLGIWLNDKEYLCDVNEHTTCDEVIELLIKPSVNEIPHSFEVNACEYKLDKMFAKQTDSSNNISNGRMDENGQNYLPRKSRLEMAYDSRIQDLFERINLLDSTIEIYDNTDIEDGLNDDEIVENQVTRLGMLLKKQSVTIKNLSKQHNTCLSTEKRTKEKLLKELEENYNRMKMFDRQLQRLQSTLDDLNWRSNKYEMRPESNIIKHHAIPCTSCSPTLTKHKFTTDPETHLRKAMVNSPKSEHGCKNDECPALAHDIYRQRDKQYSIENNNPILSDGDMVDSNNKEILTRKEIISLTFGLEDEESSVLV